MIHWTTIHHLCQQYLGPGGQQTGLDIHSFTMTKRRQSKHCQSQRQSKAWCLKNTQNKCLKVWLQFLFFNHLCAKKHHKCILQYKPKLSFMIKEEIVKHYIYIFFKIAVILVYDYSSALQTDNFSFHLLAFLRQGAKCVHAFLSFTGLNNAWAKCWNSNTRHRIGQNLKPTEQKKHTRNVWMHRTPTESIQWKVVKKKVFIW